VTAPHLVSHAQNGEDVVLWRALHQLSGGRYVEVGANSPSHDSITKSFYDAGWSGITIEPVPEFAAAHRAERPRDTMVEVAITAEPVDSITLFDIPDTGLSTAIPDISERHREQGWQPREIKVPARALSDVLAEHLSTDSPIHFMIIDTEGSERSVLESMDFDRWRPWVLVIEATAPNTNRPTYDTWEELVLQADYEFMLFDGLSRFYMAAEKRAELALNLSYPAGILDKFTRSEDPNAAVPMATQRRMTDLEGEVSDLKAQLADAGEQVVRWRALAIDGLTTATQATAASPDVQQELEAMRRTISWRVTAPLRRLRPRMNRPVAYALKVRSRIRSGR
jgi:FkbM family methyltransferase